MSLLMRPEHLMSSKEENHAKEETWTFRCMNVPTVGPDIKSTLKINMSGLSSSGRLCQQVSRWWGTWWWLCTGRNPVPHLSWDAGYQVVYRDDRQKRVFTDERCVIPCVVKWFIRFELLSYTEHKNNNKNLLKAYFYTPNFEKVDGEYCFWLVRVFVCSSLFLCLQ